MCNHVYVYIYILYIYIIHLHYGIVGVISQVLSIKHDWNRQSAAVRNHFDAFDSLRGWSNFDVPKWVVQPSYLSCPLTFNLYEYTNYNIIRNINIVIT